MNRSPNLRTKLWSPSAVAAACVLMVLLLAAGHVVSVGLREVPWRIDAIGHLLTRFDLDQERSIGTWCSSIGLAVAACLAFEVGRRVGRRGFKVMALLLALMSMDEVAAIHELASGPVRAIVELPRFLRFAWVLPGALAVLALAVISFGFVRALSRTTRRGIVLAASSYFGGALGIEMVGSYLHEEESPTYHLAVLIEECLELIGISFLLTTLARLRSPIVGDSIARRTCPRPSYVRHHARIPGAHDMNPRPLAIASLVGLAGTCHAQVMFNPAVHYPVGQEPVGGVLHDFTGDGLFDLLVATKQPDKLQIHPSLGEGFGPAITTIEVGSDSPFGVALGDLDNDGDLDIVTSLEGSNEVLMILNTSSGWELGARGAVGEEPNGIVCADFNADGHADAACHNRTSGDVSVLINNRAGGFHPAVNHPIGAETRGITAADITNDGRIDIAASSRDDRIVRILENIGGGSFQFNIDLGYGQFLEPHSLTTADMDRDGFLDIVSVTHCNRCLTEPINVYLQFNGGNHWVGPINGRLDGLAPTGVAVGDFDQDGHIDAASCNADSNDVSVCRNGGMGIFFLPVIYSVGVKPEVILSGDIDGNLTPDLVTLNTDGNDVSVLLNAVTPPCEADCDGDTICDPDELENGAIDCNGDGIPDECQPDRCKADIAPPLGVLNVFDFLAYQSAFSESSPCADLATPIGVFNVFDFLTFQTRFSQGC